MWLLIVVSLVVSSGVGGSEGVSSVTFQELHKKETCDEAVKLIKSASKHVKTWCVYDGRD